MVTKFLTLLVSLIFAGLFVCLPVKAQTIVIKEWNDTDGWRTMWNSGPPIRAESTPGAPDPPSALKFTYPKGGCEPGAAEYDRLSAASTPDIYVGHWIKYSTNFRWHPIGNKLDYLWVAAPTGDNFFVAVWGDQRMSMTTQTRWTDFRNWRSNTGLDPVIQSGRWYWLEWHAKMNTPGQRDGIFELWIDDQLVMRHTNVPYAPASLSKPVWGDFKHHPLGAHCGYAGYTNLGTLNEDMFLWIDLTVISTNRIGMPGALRSDTTPPSVPKGVKLLE